MREVIREIHRGGQHGLPIAAAYGGISNSRDVLEDKGWLTRIEDEKIVPIGALEETEALQAAERLLEACNLRNRENSDIPQMLAESTEGWAQHFHGGLRILADGTLSMGGDLNRLRSNWVIEAELEKGRRLHGNRKRGRMKTVPVYLACDVGSHCEKAVRFEWAHWKRFAGGSPSRTKIPGRRSWKGGLSRPYPAAPDT